MVAHAAPTRIVRVQVLLLLPAQPASEYDGGHERAVSTKYTVECVNVSLSKQMQHRSAVNKIGHREAMPTV